MNYLQLVHLNFKDIGCSHLVFGQLIYIGLLSVQAEQVT